VYFLFRLATPAPSCCNLRPLCGLAFATAHTLVTFFVCRLVLPLAGSRPRSGWGQGVQPKPHGAQAKCRGAAKPQRRANDTRQPPKAACRGMRRGLAAPRRRRVKVGACPCAWIALQATATRFASKRQERSARRARGSK
jgi:hypothetical protein